MHTDIIATMANMDEVVAGSEDERPKGRWYWWPEMVAVGAAALLVLGVIMALSDNPDAALDKANLILGLQFSVVGSFLLFVYVYGRWLARSTPDDSDE